MISPDPIVVAVDDARRSYPAGAQSVSALQSTNCRVHRGERIALVGRSGSGKSTLLHLMAGLDHPTSGSVTWPALGKADTLQPERIGMVFQFPSLIPWLDVLENVALPLQLAEKSDIARDRALFALKQFDLDGLAAKLPEQLSGGQAQRVALVRAIVTNPALILADEPTGQVDHATGTHLLDMLFGWAEREGVAVVIATHDPAVAARMPVRWRIEHGILQTHSEGAPS